MLSWICRRDAIPRQVLEVLVHAAARFVDEHVDREARALGLRVELRGPGGVGEVERDHRDLHPVPTLQLLRERREVVGPARRDHQIRPARREEPRERRPEGRCSRPVTSARFPFRSIVPMRPRRYTPRPTPSAASISCSFDGRFKALEGRSRGVERSSNRVERSSKRVERSSKRVERSSKRVERPSKRVERPPSGVGRSAKALERSSIAVDGRSKAWRAARQRSGGLSKSLGTGRSLAAVDRSEGFRGPRGGSRAAVPGAWGAGRSPSTTVRRA